MYEYQDFTFDPDRYPLAQVKQFVAQLHDDGQQYVVITDCGINNSTSYPPWVEGVKRGIFVKDSQGMHAKAAVVCPLLTCLFRKGNPFLGKVWPGITAWPDFWNPDTEAYWQEFIQEFLEQVPLDGKRALQSQRAMWS